MGNKLSRAKVKLIQKNLLEFIKKKKEELLIEEKQLKEKMSKQDKILTNKQKG